VVNNTPKPVSPHERDLLPILRGAGWVSVPVWMRAEKIYPAGFEPQTVQPVASCYTGYAASATHNLYRIIAVFDSCRLLLPVGSFIIQT
jgi:hypothetical protein